MTTLHRLQVGLVIAFGWLLALTINAAIPVHYADALQHEAKEQWEEAYEAYVESYHLNESSDARGIRRAIVRAFAIATDHLGRFDEAVALAEKHLANNSDGYIHRQLAMFYEEKLRNYETAREHYALSHADYLAADQPYSAAISMEKQADAYRTELYEMEYYANRRHRQAYTRRAHDLLLQCLELADQIENERNRRRMRISVMGTLANIYGLTWYSRYDPGKEQEYRQLVVDERAGRLTPRQQYNTDYRNLTREARWLEAAQLTEEYLLRFPARTNDLYFLNRLTTSYFEAGEWDSTLAAAEQTMAVIESEINAMATDIERAVAIERGWLATYSRAIHAANRLKLPERVFDIMERSRARAMLDLLGGRDYSQREQRLAEDEREVALLQSRIDEIRDTIEMERGLGRTDEVASLQRSLILVEDTTARIQRRADIARREIRAASRIDPITLEEARPLIGDHTLISIWGGIYMTVMTKDHISSRYIRGSSYFERLVRDFRGAIDQQSRRVRALVVEPEGDLPPDADDNLMDIAQELYRIIFKPVEKHFSKDSDKVYVVYDRWHPLVPYQLLHDGQQYLAEKYTLIYAPSVSVLRHCIERRRPMGDQLLALGNPNLQNPDYNLAYAEEEVKELVAIYPEARILIGDDATETAVRLLSSDADILHFACHGVIEEDDPMKSHLRLAPDRNSDGYLTVEKIMDLHLQASLVTLSACDTGRGRILQGGEILGLTRAWMYAGAPSVLASLWKVDDRATARLMTAFYENLKTHDKAESLRQAQVSMIKDGMSPFYWAAFCLYGDYQ